MAIRGRRPGARTGRRGTAGRRGAGASRCPALPRSPAARGLALAAAVLVVVAVAAGISYFREAPLRAAGLPSAQAEVLRMEQSRRQTDRVVVRYEVPARGRLTARIPVSGTFRRGERVEVRYDPADPTHVRTVEHWQPGYRSWRQLPLILGVLGALALLALRLRTVRRLAGR